MSDTGIPSVEPTNDAPPSDPGDYHGRIRSEGDFAVDEIQKKDSHIGELHAKVNGYKPLDQYIQAAGGAEELIALAIEGSNARQTAATPPAPNPDTPEEPEIYDPEIKAINEKYQARLASQDAVINEMQKQLTVTSAAAVKGSLTENIGTALADFSSSPELSKKAEEAIMGAVETSERLAKSGDGNAARNLEQLAGPDGIKALRMMTADIYREMALAGKSTTETESEVETKSPATDAPSGTRSMLGTDGVTVNAGTRVTANTVREIMEQVAEKRGLNPSKLFG